MVDYSISGSKQILLIDTEESICESVNSALTSLGYSLFEQRSTPIDLDYAASMAPDLIIVDIQMFNGAGITICNNLLSHSVLGNVPIVVFTALAEESTIIATLELGVRDYVLKSFSVNLLVAKVRSIFGYQEQSRQDEQTPIAINGITIDPVARQVRNGDRMVILTDAEFDTLFTLCAHRETTLSRADIIANIHGQGYSVSERVVDVFIQRLRAKDDVFKTAIQTVRGKGYRYCAANVE